MPPLPSVSRHFGNGDPLHAEARDGHLQVVELPRPNDCSDHFHRFGIVIRWSGPYGHAYAPFSKFLWVNVLAFVQSAGSMPAQHVPQGAVAARKSAGAPH